MASKIESRRLPVMKNRTRPAIPIDSRMASENTKVEPDARNAAPASGVVASGGAAAENRPAVRRRGRNFRTTHASAT